MGELSDFYRKMRARADDLLGRGDPEARAYLRSPGLRPDVRHSFGRRLLDLPRQNRAATETAPRMPPRFIRRTLDEPPPFPFMPTTRLERAAQPWPQGHPGGYDNFADFANARDGLRLPRLRSDATVPSSALPARGLEPPDAPGGAGGQDDMNAAWNDALARARASIAEENHAAWRRLPRSGNPAVGTFAREVRDLPRRR
jgi:hypothetical protein